MRFLKNNICDRPQIPFRVWIYCHNFLTYDICTEIQIKSSMSSYTPIQILPTPSQTHKSNQIKTSPALSQPNASQKRSLFLRRLPTPSQSGNLSTSSNAALHLVLVPLDLEQFVDSGRHRLRAVSSWKKVSEAEVKGDFLSIAAGSQRDSIRSCSGCEDGPCRKVPSTVTSRTLIAHAHTGFNFSNCGT